MTNSALHQDCLKVNTKALCAYKEDDLQSFEKLIKQREREKNGFSRILPKEALDRGQTLGCSGLQVPSPGLERLFRTKVILVSKLIGSAN